MTYVEPSDRQPRLNRHRWDVARAAAMRRSDYRCECGEPARIVHHIVAIADGGDAGDPDNLEGLCVLCHVNKHRKVPDTLRPTWDKLLK